MAKQFVGIDFGGTSIKIAVVEDGKIIHESPRIKPQGYTRSIDLIKILAETVLNLKELFPTIMGVGIGVPGFVDFPTGIVYNLTNVAGWEKVQLKESIQKLTKMPCAVENDANCMTVAEWKLGAGVGVEHLLCLTLGTGVGGGIIANNQILRGANCVAGEMGQMTIDYNGNVGNYNNKGALEKYVGNNQIAALVQERYSESGEKKELEACFPHYLYEYAKEGDEIAIQCWDEIARKLAASLASTCWLLNPKMIIIGGGVSNAGDYLFTPLKAHLFSQLSEPFKENLIIKKAYYGNEAGMIGAAHLASELLWSD